MMKNVSIVLLSVLMLNGFSACKHSQEKTGSNEKTSQQKVVKKKRDDGTLSSVSQVDENNFVHGLQVSYYEDGRTIHSKVTYEHGVKMGPAIWYYKNGQMFEYTNFAEGKRNGLTKKYHSNGQLLSQCEYEKGSPLPGLVEFDKEGVEITDYPTVRFKKIDKLAFENRVIVEISSTVKSNKVKYYYLLRLSNGNLTRGYLETKAGKAFIEYTVAKNDVLLTNIEIYAELPTELGNILVRKFNYKLAVKNS